MRYTWLLLGLLLLNGCYAIGHGAFVDIRNNVIGKEVYFKKPFKFKNAGKLRRANFAINGQGLTHITKNKNGDLVYHLSEQEILPIFANRGWRSGNKKWVGKCLTYQVVDPKTYIVKGWGFDKGGNPLSCRIWS